MNSWAKKKASALSHGIGSPKAENAVANVSVLESSQGFASQIPLQAINAATFSQEYHNLLGKAVNRGSKASSGRVDYCNSGPKHLRIGLACYLQHICKVPRGKNPSRPPSSAKFLVVVACSQEIRGHGVHVLIFGSFVRDGGAVGGQTEEWDGRWRARSFGTL
nr:hypothetical protein CFP56_08825 [Quercus suber]